MNYDYIKEELNLLLKDEFLLDFKLEELSNGDKERENINEINKIFITTIENDLLEISLNDNFCYKIDSVNNKKIENLDKKNELFEDLGVLLDNYSPGYRDRFNNLLTAKLIRLQEN